MIRADIRGNKILRILPYTIMENDNGQKNIKFVFFRGTGPFYWKYLTYNHLSE